MMFGGGGGVETNPETRKRSSRETKASGWANEAKSGEGERREGRRSLDCVTDIPPDCLVDSPDDAGSGILLLHFLEARRVGGCLGMTPPAGHRPRSSPPVMETAKNTRRFPRGGP